jgi:uncharacterized protein
MLISFSVENCLSFKEKTVFSMQATNERQHNERLPYLDEYELRVLPISAIYGGNASGKSNFVKAISLARKIILTVPQPDGAFPVEPFLLDQEYENKPSIFIFEFYLEGIVYEYGFSITRNCVEKEWLIKNLKTTSKEIFNRLKQKIDVEYLSNADKSSNGRLTYISDSTKENQLFLTKAFNDNVKYFEPIFSWFNKSLLIISPDVSFSWLNTTVPKEDPFHEKISNILSSLDTGIQRLGKEEIDFDKIPFGNSFKELIIKDMSENKTSEIKDKNLFISKINGRIKAERIITHHINKNNKEIPFELNKESDGTKRLIDILPIFLDILNINLSITVLIDELDRSLHTLLTRQLIQNFLDCCSEKTRSQLIFTTHDVLLMDQKLLRRDEMWVTERNYYGESSLYSFSEFKKIRFDKNIRKSYLEGRLGGIPRILAESCFIPSTIENSEE